MGRIWVLAVRDGRLAALLEQGQAPTYHGPAALRAATRLAVGESEDPAEGLVADRALARLLAAGFTLVCRRGA